METDRSTSRGSFFSRYEEDLHERRRRRAQLRAEKEADEALAMRQVMRASTM